MNIDKKNVILKAWKILRNYFWFKNIFEFFRDFMAD